MMEKWPIGVFTSVDAGLGVKLEVAHELGVPTIQLHAPAKATRTQAHADRFLARLREVGITLTAVFGGFEGESYADIPTVMYGPGDVSFAHTVNEHIEINQGIEAVCSIALMLIKWCGGKI